MISLWGTVSSLNGKYLELRAYTEFEIDEKTNPICHVFLSEDSFVPGNGQDVIIKGDLDIDCWEMTGGMVRINSKSFILFQDSAYRVDVPWDTIEEMIVKWQTRRHLEIDPDFQRGHVWSLADKIAFVDWRMKGGPTGGDIHFNHPEWDSLRGKVQLIDGLQRLTAVREFMRGDFAVNGYYIEDLNLYRCFLTFHVHKMPTRRAILEWYLAMNSCGVRHTQDDLDRVRGLLADEIKREKGK